MVDLSWEKIENFTMQNKHAVFYHEHWGEIS
jgi:hypothetical protein